MDTADHADASTGRGGDQAKQPAPARGDFMQTHLVLTVIGRDRPGLVKAVSETVAAAGGNWLDTRMATLAGQFAGMLLVAIAPEKADHLVASLEELESQGLRFIIETGVEAVPSPGRMLRLELVGHDRPGIVRDVSGVLAARNVSITELESEQVSGSFSGEAMFKATARLKLPPDLDPADLRRSIEALANELMVDLELDDV
jgi:glycine cleavage system regulatory protein